MSVNLGPDLRSVYMSTCSALTHTWWQVYGEGAGGLLYTGGNTLREGTAESPGAHTFPGLANTAGQGWPRGWGEPGPVWGGRRGGRGTGAPPAHSRQPRRLPSRGPPGLPRSPGLGHSLTVWDVFTSWLSHSHKISDMVQPGPPTASGGETKPTCSRPPVATGNPLLRKRVPAGAQQQARGRGVTEPRSWGKKILACPLLAGMTAMCAGARCSPGPEIGG